MSTGNKWALILGASSGMGEACARHLHARGRHIFGLHLDTLEQEPHVRALVDELNVNGTRARFFNMNAARPSVRADVIAAMRESIGADGALDVVVHSLAFGALRPFISAPGEPRISAAQLEMTMNVMAHSLVYWTQDLFDARLLREGSKVFAVTSAGSTRVAATYGAVSAAKAALEAHVRQLSHELAPFGVAVNAIRAGVTLTPALRKIPGYEQIVEHVVAINPSHRLTTTQDVAEAIGLLSEASSAWMTGNVVGVDGGEYFSS